MSYLMLSAKRVLNSKTIIILVSFKIKEMPYFLWLKHYFIVNNLISVLMIFEQHYMYALSNLFILSLVL